MENSKIKRNIKPFDGEKYSVWKFRVRNVLSELNVLKVIDYDNEPNPKPIGWDQAERLAKSIIIEYLADSYLNYAGDNVTAKQVFKKLDGIYERKSLATQLALRKKLLTLKLKGDTTLMKHFAVFDELVSELLAAGAHFEEADKVSHLLLTLPANYDGVVTAIETLTEDNLTLAFVKTRLLDQEVKLKNENNDTSAKVLNITREEDNTKNFKKRNFSNGPQNNSNFKNQCNLQNNKRFKSNANNNKRKFKCHFCGRSGHKISDCYFKKKRQQYLNDKNKSAQIVEKQEPSTSFSTTSPFAFMTGDFQLETKDKLIFIIDSGASDHLINNDKLFESFIELNPPVKVSVAKSGTFILATKKGKVNVISNMGVQGALEDVLYCPEVPHNLLSVRRMQQAGMKVIFDKNGVEVIQGGNIVIKGRPMNNLVVVDFIVDANSINAKCKIYNVNKIDYELWHQRLGHIGKSKFLEIKNKQMVDDVSQIENIVPNDNICEACINGKQARLPFNKAKEKAYVKRPLFIVHSDVCGPITPSTVDNKNYFVIFIDEFTHYCVTYLITYKSDVFSIFKDYIAKSEAHFNLKVVNLYIDNGREYLSKEMKDYCIEKGITYHLTVPRTPQLNGVSERMIRTLTEKARAMISGAKLEKIFWGEAVLTATYLINISPTKALKSNKTPFEMWHGKKPQLKYLKIFGSTVYIHNKIKQSKFDDKSWKGILIGYEPNGYKAWDVDNGKFVVVRDVIVDEINFLNSRPTLELKEIEKLENKVEKKSDVNKSDTLNSTIDCSSRKIVKLNDMVEKSVIETDKVEKSVIETDKAEKSVIETDISNDSLSQNKESKEQTKFEPRRSERIKHQPSISYKETNDYILCAQSIICKIPSTYQEIKDRDDRVHWEQAINDEINSLLINETWTLVDRPKHKNIVDCKWVFAIKNDEFGNPIRYKARLVARGFTQEYLVDYDETFAPVARISSFRFIIAFANQFNLLIHHMDVKTAFLNGKLNEEIYMKIPEGVKSNSNQVCKLNKALYGLKQAARCWFQTFEKALTEIGFQNSSVDRCIYILNRNDILKNIYAVLYVDDLVIVTANQDTMSNFKIYLMNKFRMTDLKDIKLFLGIKVERNNNTLTLDQSSYIRTVLDKFKMSDCNSVDTPLPSKLNYEALNLDVEYDAPCRNLIGCLMYVMVCTRPDLSTAVNILSRYTSKNNKELWQCLKRVLRYLKGSINVKLTYKQGEYNDILCGYVDSDWGGSDGTDRKSTTGYVFKLFERCTICWNTKRQASVAASSTEAEYMALFEAVREALWLKSLAASINIIFEKPIIIYEDNNGCISIASNPTSHKRSKHIDIKYHFSREQVEKKIIKIVYIPTGNQLADMLTKPLPGVKFLVFRKEIGLE